MYCVLTENEHKISQKSTSTAHNNNTITLSNNSQHADSCQKLYTYDSSSQHGPNQLSPQNLVNMCKIGLFYHDISIVNLLFI